MSASAGQYAHKRTRASPAPTKTRRGNRDGVAGRGAPATGVGSPCRISVFDFRFSEGMSVPFRGGRPADDQAMSVRLLAPNPGRGALLQEAVLVQLLVQAHAADPEFHRHALAVVAVL